MKQTHVWCCATNRLQNPLESHLSRGCNGHTKHPVFAQHIGHYSSSLYSPQHASKQKAYSVKVSGFADKGESNKKRLTLTY